MTVLSTIIDPVICILVLGIAFGAKGILGADFVRILLLMLSVYLYYFWKTKKLLPGAEDYLALPESFEINPKDIISLDIRDCEDISLTSKQIELFCKGHKIDTTIGKRAAVCFEELAVNIIRFGFPKCRKQPGIHLRLVYCEDVLTLRLRDNCPMFDVERYITKKTYVDLIIVRGTHFSLYSPAPPFFIHS